MQKKKIAFINFWKGFNPSTFIFYKILAKHYNVELCNKEEADYLFYSCFGGDNHYCVSDQCVKIFYTGENRTPDFNDCDYAIGFEHMIFNDRYLRFPLYLLYKECELMERKHMDIDLETIKYKRKNFCSFTVSNERAQHRIAMFDALNAYKHVDSGGRYLNNIGGPIEDKYKFDCEHKFSIAFENCSYIGYCTEKLIQAFAARTIPIYWGDPLVSDVFDSNAFINVHDFNSYEDVVEKVKEIDKNDSLWVKMLKTPALVSDAYSLASMKNKLELFLLNIFEQPIESAKRRSPFAMETQAVRKASAVYGSLPLSKRAFYYLKRRWTN